MRLSSLADYAVVLMAAAARHAVGTRLSATLLSAETGVPLPTAQKLAGKLSAAGLLETQRGAAGGFVLAKSSETISLVDIVEAVEGPIALTSCVEEAKHDCALESACKVRPHWGVVNDAVRGAFASVKLSHLSHPANLSHPVRPEPVEGPSFSLEKQDRASTNSARTDLTAVSVA
jgi:FeS assembly SUF system regulator